MQAGKLRHKLVIQSRTEAPDSIGHMVSTWSEFATVYGSVEPLIGREYLAAQQVQSEVSHKLRIRWLNGATTKMRVLFGSRVFDINSVLNVEERGREMLLMCKEAVS